jgi:hypothetical protein
MNEIRVNRQTYPVPSTWNELNAAQLRTTAKVLHSGQPTQWAMAVILISLFEMKKRWWLGWTFLMRMTPEQQYDCLLFTDWVWQPITLTKAVIPVVKIGRKKLYAAKDGIIGSLTFIELIKCEVAYMRYRMHVADADKREKALDTLCGILYRPANEKGLRMSYVDDELPLFEMLAQKIPRSIRLATLLWYDGCRSAWTPMYPEIYRKGNEKDFDTEGEPDDSGESWVQHLRMMAGGALHMESMSYVKAELALYDLNERIRENKEAVARMNKAKRK